MQDSPALATPMTMQTPPKRVDMLTAEQTADRTQLVKTHSCPARMLDTTAHFYPIAITAKANGLNVILCGARYPTGQSDIMSKFEVYTIIAYWDTPAICELKGKAVSA